MTGLNGRTALLPHALLPLALLMLIVSCASSPKATTPATDEIDDPLASLSWLVGTWNGSMGGVQMQEHWVPSEGGLMLGVNRSVRGAEAIAFEFLRIEARDETEARDEDAIVYVAQPGGKSPGTEFTLTMISGTRAVFSNPQHDFPQNITYAREGTHLTVELTGIVNGQMGGFSFEWDLSK